MWAVLDSGCRECGMEDHVVAVYHTKWRALRARDREAKRQEAELAEAGRKGKGYGLPTYLVVLEVGSRRSLKEKEW